jgi:hypothetical protein
MRPLLALLLTAGILVCPGCDYDDPDDPGAEAQVDFIKFSGPGRFGVVFVDLVFQSGEFALDVIADQQPRIWKLGPGTDMISGTDDDVAPYPNPTNSRKRTAHDGEWDRRYWIQFAGGAWSSLNIVADERAKFRASSSPPSFLPMTFHMWCPDGRACMTWALAKRAASGTPSTDSRARLPPAVDSTTRAFIGA